MVMLVKKREIKLAFENKLVKKKRTKHSCTNEKKNYQVPSLSGGNIATLWDSYSGLYINPTQVCQKEICANMLILTKNLIADFSMENGIFYLHAIKDVEIVPERNRTDSFSSLEHY